MLITVSVDINAALPTFTNKNYQHISTGPYVHEIERIKKLETRVNSLTKPSELTYKLCDLVELDHIVKGIGNSSAAVTIQDRRAVEAMSRLLSNQLEGMQPLIIVCVEIKRDMNIMLRFC